MTYQVQFLRTATRHGFLEIAMNKIRLLLLILTIVVVGTALGVFSLYARGYRLNPQTLEVAPGGILVIKSHPDSAQVFINGEFKGATNATLNLPPATYDVSVRKEGYITWNKRIEIQKEEVTEATAHLFKAAPSLSAITLSGIINPTPSRDFSKIAYAVPPGSDGTDTQGLWVMEMVNLPIGFSREPRRLTDGNMTNATWEWSPDGREMLLTVGNVSFLLNTSEFTPQAQRVNISARVAVLKTEWQEEMDKRLESNIAQLPDEVQDVLRRKSSQILFSPDEDMIAYVASSSATLPDDLITPFPGASTQKENRIIETGKTYIYDIKEDRNFLVDEISSDLVLEGGNNGSGKFKRRLSWFPTSRNLILGEIEKITILDYDGTNRQTVYSGSYFSPHAFPSVSLDRIIILTNLGASSTPPNLYSLGLK